MCCHDVEVQLGPVAPPTDIAIEVLQVRRLQIAPAVLVQHRAGNIGRCIIDLLAVLEFGQDLPEGAAGEIGLEALPCETVLELNVHRAAKCVQAEYGIGTFDIDPVDCDVRDEIPIHGIAEGLVEPQAVYVDRQTLGSSLQARSGEPVIEKCRLERIARRGVQTDSADLLIERLDQVGRPLATEVAAVQHMGFRRNRVAVDPEPMSGDAPTTSTGGNSVAGGAVCAATLPITRIAIATMISPALTRRFSLRLDRASH